MTLQEFFEKNPVAALAFSGGVDSAYLLYAAMQYGKKIKPYFIKTPFQPEFELQDAKKLAKELSADLTVLSLDVLSDIKVVQNPSNRCYYCKRALFTKLVEQAKKDGFSLLIDGTNASDDAGDRPGMRALKELSVCSPLRECGLTKQEIRQLSKKAGLFTWNKPAYACLATRIPTGIEITAKSLKQIEQAEDILFQMGFSDFRVRYFEGAAKIQLPQEQMIKAIKNRENILKAFKESFTQVLLDLAGRE